jgi:hypothetical protein
MLRLAGAQPRRGAGGALPRPEQLREVFRPPGRGARRRPRRRVRSGRTSSTTSRTGGRMSRRPDRRSGSRRRGSRGRLHLRRRHRGHARGRRRGACARASRAVKIGLADPDGAALYNWYAHGELKAEGSSITEGHRAGAGSRATSRASRWISALQHPGLRRAIPIVFDLLGDEGLCLGGSSGINVAGAIRLARDLGPGQDDRHHPLRLRDALPVEAVRSRLSPREEPPGSGVARARPFGASGGRRSQASSVARSWTTRSAALPCSSS